MIKWEYKVIGEPTIPLTELGLEGWDLCSVTHDLLYPKYKQHIFKRPIEEKIGGEFVLANAILNNIEDVNAPGKITPMKKIYTKEEVVKILEEILEEVDKQIVRKSDRDGNINIVNGGDIINDKIKSL